MTNAIQYNKESGEIRLATRVENGTVELTVADTGPGIAPQELWHVFERFYRSDKSRTRASGGTGLGLAISKMIVEAHGGTISASNQLNGAMFSVRFPVR